VSEVLRSAVDLFALAPTHERAEIRAFADLITGLIPDATVEDRAHVAHRLAHRADTPPSVARLLASDVIAVARPVVLRSPVLTSSDLVEIMRHGPAHVELVAERLDLAPDVALALGRSIDAEIAVRSPRREAQPATPTIEEMRAEAILGRAAGARPIGDAETESEVALQRALDELAAELEAEETGRSSATARSEDEAEAALQHALDRLANELDAEARAWEDEDAAARVLRHTAPGIAGDLDVFLSHDSAGRWRFIQEHTATTTLAPPPPPRRRRSDDPAAVGARLFGALVAGERERLAEELGRAARLDHPVVERILTDRNGEALAITLAALGIDERTATSILLLHSGERATLTHMQDLSAMAGRIGWRTAENIVQTWRGGRGLGRVETARVVEQSDRRGVGRQETSGADRADATGDGERLRGNER
jgi:uncharacterized protein (DUF2336 family)